MIVRELKATIMCPECNNSFIYSALAIHSSIESVYKIYLEPQLKECTKCRKADMIVKDANCTIKSNRSRCTISWRCLHCDTTWQQSEYLDRGALANGKTISQTMPKVTCPNVFCLSKADVMMTGIKKAR
jgi:hypothetical protein